jgi:hypothetical protein
MAIYTVLAPPDEASAADPMKAVFVKDGFSWPALFFAAPWLVFRRMWLVLVLYLAVMIGLSIAIERSGADEAGFVVILLHILFALEANNLRRWTLERRGFRLVGVAEGRNLEEAELRHFAGLEAGAAAAGAAIAPPPTPPVPPVPPVPPAPQRGPGQPSAEAGDVVGLFPSPAVPRGTTP